MGNFFDEDDDDPVDLAAVEARHAEMEAEAEVERLEAEHGAAGTEPEKVSEERPAQAADKTDKPEPEESVQTAGGKILGATRRPARAKAAAAGGTGNPDDSQYRAEDWEAIIEAVLFTMGNSVELKQLAVAIGQSEEIAKRVVLHLKKRYEEEKRGMRILELENAYQMCTCADYYENLIRVAATPKKHVLTDVIMETLSIIAYRQPVTKMEIGKIRGVNSDHAVNRLVEYGLVYEAGRLDAPGRPALFATTEEFLRRFGVSSMVDLPTMNPEQEEEIIQEVEEELQMKLGEQTEETVEPEQEVSEAVREILDEREAELAENENEEEEESYDAEDQN